MVCGNYPPSLLNVFKTESARTNNHIEGWHSKLKKVVDKVYQKKYEIVEIFKREQSVTEFSINQSASGGSLSQRVKRNINREKSIEKQ